MPTLFNDERTIWQVSAEMPQVDEVRRVRFGTAVHLEEGTCYLVRGKSAESSYRFARRSADDGVPVLCVSRIYPERLQARYGISDATMWWISTSPGDNTFNPTAPGTLASAIERFIEAYPDGSLVLLDGLEYIAINVGTDKTILFLEHLNEFVMPRRATLLIPISPECFETTDFARLERFTEGIEESDLRDALDAQDASRALGDD